MTLVADLTGGALSFSSISTGTTSLVRAGNMEFTLTNPTPGSYTMFSGSNISGAFTSVTVGGVALNDMGGGFFNATLGGFDYTFSNATNILSATGQFQSDFIITFLGHERRTGLRRTTVRRGNEIGSRRTVHEQLAVDPESRPSRSKEDQAKWAARGTIDRPSPARRPRL
jgi:hypothetical protein